MASKTLGNDGGVFTAGTSELLSLARAGGRPYAPSHRTGGEEHTPPHTLPAAKRSTLSMYDTAASNFQALPDGPYEASAVRDQSSAQVWSRLCSVCTAPTGG